jgi:hypothetical protein
MGNPGHALLHLTQVEADPAHLAAAVAGIRSKFL